jgi:hypothetical protein
MLIKITTKKGVIVTTTKTDELCIKHGHVLLGKENQEQLIDKKEILAIEIEDYSSQEYTYSFPNLNTNDWSSSLCSLITINVRNKYIRKFLSWIFQQQPTKIK